MPVLATVNSVFRNLFRKQRVEEDLDDEMRCHLELLTDENIRRGMKAREAARAARLELGGVEQIKERVRDARAGVWLETLWQDIRFASRMLRKSPGFTAAAVLTLALGIGANTAIFSIVNTVLLKPLPYPQADRIVQFEMSIPGNANFSISSIPKYMVWREQTQVFEDTALFDFGAGLNLTGDDRPQQLNGLRVSASYFRLFGARVTRGRTFTADEDVPNGPRLAVISNGLWRNHYGSDPGTVGKEIEIGGEAYEVIGILDAGFRWDRFLSSATDVWLPLQADPSSANQSNNLIAVARLKSGVSLEQAKAALKVAYQIFKRKFPDAEGAGQSFTTERFDFDDIVNIRPALLLLTGTVVFLLVISCTNVANLHLARAAIRTREIAIRATLGAGRRRILRQLLTESVLLSMGGGMLGLVIGYVAMRALLSLNPSNVARIGDKGAYVSMDWRVFTFTLGVSLLTGILFGLVPAIHAWRADLNASLKEGDSRPGGGLRQNKTRATLVVTEIALALILMAGAALLIRTYVAMRTVPPGFDPHNILTVDMSLDGPRFQKAAGVAQLARDGVEEVEGVSGVESAALASSVPLRPTYHETFTIEGHPLPKDGYDGAAAWRSITPNYFKVFRIPLLRGRSFNERDNAGAARVVVINETMATQFWPEGDPLGDRITIDKGAGPPFSDTARQIVGVVGDARDDEPDRKLLPTVYIPISQVSDDLTALDNQNLPMMWVVRTRVAPDSLNAAIQRELRAASGGLPVGHIRTMDEVIVESTAQQSFNMLLMSIFASLALLLAAIGVYGLTAYSVQQRRREIGIRRALGAQRTDVLGMVLRDGLLLCLTGIAVGILGAFAMTRLMRSLIFGVSPTDPMTYVSIPIFLAGVALLACYIPARRATKVDPMVALRHE